MTTLEDVKVLGIGSEYFAEMDEEVEADDVEEEDDEDEDDAEEAE